MEHVRETFRRLLNSHIAPAMHDRGFVGAGKEWMLPDSRYWALLGFQIGLSDAERRRFTIGVSTVSKEDWRTARHRFSLPNPPRPNITYVGTSLRHMQIGRLLETGENGWWIVRAGDDVEPLARTVLNAIDASAIPEILKQMRPAA